MSLFSRPPSKEQPSTTVDDLVAQGTVYARQGNFTEAIRCFDGALRLQPASSALWIRRGNACRDFGDGLGAITCYDEAIRLRPGISAPWTLKGNVPKDQGNHRGAVDCYDAALEVHPDNLVAGKNHAEATRALRRSTTVKEWIDGGLSYFDNGNYARANECYEVAIALDPAEPAAWKNRASVLDRQGTRSEAIYCGNRAIELDRGRV
jgi:tetratricopeptide (TPR) repeat protein